MKNKNCLIILLIVVINYINGNNKSNDTSNMTNNSTYDNYTGYTNEEEEIIYNELNNENLNLFDEKKLAFPIENNWKSSISSVISGFFNMIFNVKKKYKEFKRPSKYNKYNNLTSKKRNLNEIVFYPYVNNLIRNDTNKTEERNNLHYYYKTQYIPLRNSLHSLSNNLLVGDWNKNGSNSIYFKNKTNNNKGKKDNQNSIFYSNKGKMVLSLGLKKHYTMSGDYYYSLGMQSKIYNSNSSGGEYIAFKDDSNHTEFFNIVGSIKKEKSENLIYIDNNNTSAGMNSSIMSNSTNNNSNGNGNINTDIVDEYTIISNKFKVEIMKFQLLDRVESISK